MSCKKPEGQRLQVVKRLSQCCDLRFSMRTKNMVVTSMILNTIIFFLKFAKKTSRNIKCIYHLLQLLMSLDCRIIRVLCKGEQYGLSLTQDSFNNMLIKPTFVFLEILFLQITIFQELIATFIWYQIIKQEQNWKQLQKQLSMLECILQNSRIQILGCLQVYAIPKLNHIW